MCDWLNKVYGFIAFQLLYMTLFVHKMDECGFDNTACRERLPRRLR